MNEILKAIQDNKTVISYVPSRFADKFNSLTWDRHTCQKIHMAYKIAAGGVIVKNIPTKVQLSKFVEYTK